MCSRVVLLAFTAAALRWAARPAAAAEVAVLAADNWQRMAPRGKEVDAIHGDLVLRNDKLVAVVAWPGPRRHASYTTHDVGGLLIDLAARDHESDQLAVFQPGAAQRLRFVGAGTGLGDDQVDAAMLRRTPLRARAVSVTFAGAVGDESGPGAGVPVEVRYLLRDGEPFLRVQTNWGAPGGAPAPLVPVDWLRIDDSQDGAAIERAAPGELAHYWAHDRWFQQAYAVFAFGRPLLAARQPGRRAPVVLSYGAPVGQARAPGAAPQVERAIAVARSLAEARAIAARAAGTPLRRVAVAVNDPDGLPVEGADVEIEVAGATWGHLRSDARGAASFELPASGEVVLTVAARGHGQRKLLLAREATRAVVPLARAGWLEVEVTDDAGQLIPAKVQLFGRFGTYNPSFGPDHQAEAMRNLLYLAGGRARHKLEPGRYDAIVSRGPEYDAVFASFEIVAGQSARLAATLRRAVDTRGWVSADLHTHSTESGDNVSSQRGRVLSLLAEHIEFAPCTEHNRVSSYAEHLRALGATTHLATASGIELTGAPFELGHHNAFPLRQVPGAQGGGGPWPDEDVEVQIERLALWDDRGEKLVQQNHPDLRRLYLDRDGDGVEDGGFARGIGFLNVVEVHPPDAILWPPFSSRWPPRAVQGRAQDNRLWDWMRVLDAGHRIPGVVNSDAHSNYQESGGLRNWVRSPTDRPAELQVLDLVRALRRGHVVLSNGPFLQVRAFAAGGDAQQAVHPGDTLVAPGGRVRLLVRAQAPDWFDLDRVQVLVDGRYAPAHNFTRASHAGWFRDGSVKFEQAIDLTLARDGYVIVFVTDEDRPLGKVAGHYHEHSFPVALSNPIYVDVDGGGWQAPGARR